jgi:hypothetical protein
VATLRLYLVSYLKLMIKVGILEEVLVGLELLEALVLEEVKLWVLGMVLVLEGVVVEVVVVVVVPLLPEA